MHSITVVMAYCSEGRGLAIIDGAQAVKTPRRLQRITIRKACL